jgi:hypothetical protein
MYRIKLLDAKKKVIHAGKLETDAEEYEVLKNIVILRSNKKYTCDEMQAMAKHIKEISNPDKLLLIVPKQTEFCELIKEK